MRNILFVATALLFIQVEADNRTVHQSNKLYEETQAFKFHSAEKQLIKHLMEKYERVGKIGRPVRNTNETVNVQFGLSLIQLMDLDEADQMFTVNVWNKFVWRDELLMWDPKQHGDIQYVRIPVNHVWTPDIVLINFADKRMVELREVLLTVDYTGHIYWSPPAIYKSICRIQMEHFPFDHQICYLRFASWTLDGRRLNLTFLDGIRSSQLDDYQESSEWNVVKYPAVRRFFRQTCCDVPFPNLIFFYVLRRNPDFYAYLLVLPCILLAVLNLVTFWLPPQNPARMMIGVNVFSAFCIQMKFLTLSTPSFSNTIPYLGYYYCLNMVLIAIFSFFSLISVEIHFQMNKAQPLPSWLAMIVNKSTRLLCINPGLKCLSKASTSPSHGEETNLSRIEMRLARDRRRRHEDAFASRGCPSCHCSCQQSQQQQQQQPLAHYEPPTQVVTTGPSSSAFGRNLESSLKEIKKALRNLMHKFNEKDQAARLVGDWTVVGMVVDRYCFWAYLIIVVVTGTISLFSPMPYVYDSLTDEDLIQHFNELANHVAPIDFA